MNTILTLAALWTSPSFAADPSAPTVAGENVVTTGVMVAADAATVRAALADPVTACRLNGDVLDAKVIGKEGNCSLVQVTTRGLSTPLTYVTRRCPTADGYAETMVRSDDFDNQSSTWHVSSVSGGAQVTLQVRSEPRLPVPQRMINAAVGTSVVQTLKNLVQRVTGR